MHLRLTVALGLSLCACKQPMAAPPPPAHPAQAAAPEPVPDDQPPPRDPFALDENSDDPAAALEGMKHNCCDEMPAKEIREHVGNPGSK